jgi:1A family penicillin-binding protein
MIRRKPKTEKPLSRYLRGRHPYGKIALVLGGLFLLVLGVIILWIATTPIPALNTFDPSKFSNSTRIYDRTGKVLLYDLDHNIKRSTVPLSDISPNLQNATIAIEDASFYNHGGISLTGIARSFLADIMQHSFAQGGSTITQQVVKNTILNGKKSIIRKVQEWILSIRLEHRYTKAQILEFYFNVTPYGGTIYGAQVASHTFFGKDAKDLDIAESAYLAAIPQLPTYYSPFGTNRAALDTRKNLVLGRMKELGYITADQYSQAKVEKVAFSQQQDNSIIAPHFVFYIQQYLEQKFGPDVATQGLTVITTIDADLQNKAETTVHDYAITNQKKFKASNAALMAIDPKTGQILAMVGSRNYFDTAIDGNYNAALALRQPGSSFKPFVYAAALQKGYTPETAIFDLPTQFSTTCSPTDTTNDIPPCYSPGNFDGNFRGPMTFTTALAQSINVPAVKTLYLAGISNVLTLAKNMGITTLGKTSDYGLSLALGAAEVRLIDLTSAYAAFANNGVVNEPTGLLSVTDSTGAVLESYAAAPHQTIEPAIAQEISSMLSNNTARFPEYPANNPFHFPGYDVAAKTGTTNESRDAWTVGYTPSIAIGVWAGNNDNTPMVKEIAGYIVAPMWNTVMQYALKKYPQEFFTAPPAIPETAPFALRGLYSDGTSVHDILNWVKKDSPMTLGNSVNDGQYQYWEYPVSLWLSGAGSSTAAVLNSTTATTSPAINQSASTTTTTITVP